MMRLLCARTHTLTHTLFFMIDNDSHWKYAVFDHFYKNVTDGPTDQRINGRTHPLIEMQGRI